MDIVNAEQAKIPEEAGACAVMALERVPADIRAAGGVARMADPTIIEAIRYMRLAAVQSFLMDNTPPELRASVFGIYFGLVTGGE